MKDYHPHGGYLGDDLSRKIRKSASCEPLVDGLSSDDEEYLQGIESNQSGGALLASAPSPSAIRVSLPKKSASDKARSLSPGSESFRVDANVEDDVFAGNMSTHPAAGLINRFKEMQVDISNAREIANDRSNVVDAQGIYPPTACIFAGNLSQQASDETLQSEVEKVFSKFGEVFVKIRRDNRNMPFAFCQFTNEYDAQEAERLGKGVVILGRPCRTEMVRAHTSFIIYQVSGRRTSAEEAVALLGVLGEVARADVLPNTVASQYGIANGILVTYKMYDPTREVIQYFRENNKYKVIAYEPKRDTRPKFDQYRSSTHVDERSAYFGNMPVEMSKETFSMMVSACGALVSVEFYKKPILSCQGKMTCFGFVEYAKPESAEEAIRTMHNTNIDGYTIRVERKRSRPPYEPTVQYATFPRRRRETQFPREQNHLESLFAPSQGSSSQNWQGSAPDHRHDIPRSSMEATHVGMETPESMKPISVPRSTGHRFHHHRPRDPTSPCSIPKLSFPSPQGQGPQASIPWMQYAPYGFSPLSPFGPISPHAHLNQGLVYQSFVHPPVYHNMYPDYVTMVPPSAAARDGRTSIDEQSSRSAGSGE
ncbi:hypothetical protein VHEMI07096 [[Torrubiella] hemipterigena]|uniref:RRM domain-containing protein n=1 Tax=[Torrubiella] hemipterigena TaxID=1531966 RepID=A0A0A1TL12_9HYPO|nr:hypothetical protein VHEMI07096 [[Torrubiella] hemipterigena]